MGYSDHSLAATIIHDTLWTSVPGTPLFKHKLGPNEKSYPKTFFALSFFEGAHVPRGHMYPHVNPKRNDFSETGLNGIQTKNLPINYLKSIFN